MKDDQNDRVTFRIMFNQLHTQYFCLYENCHGTLRYHCFSYCSESHYTIIPSDITHVKEYSRLFSVLQLSDRNWVGPGNEAVLELVPANTYNVTHIVSFDKANHTGSSFNWVNYVRTRPAFATHLNSLHNVKQVLWHQ